MKKDVFILVVGIVLFCSGIFSLSLGYIVQSGINFNGGDELLAMGAVLILLGVISFIYSAIIVFLNNRKIK